MLVMALPTELSSSKIKPTHTSCFLRHRSRPHCRGQRRCLGGGLYCNWTMTMRISKKRRISTERETITRIFIEEKAYMINLNLSIKNSTMARRSILMNTCISTKKRTRAKKNVKSGTKKTRTRTMITKKMNTRSKTGVRYLTGSFIRTLRLYKHSDISNVDDRALSIMIPLQIPRKLYPVLYV